MRLLLLEEKGRVWWERIFQNHQLDVFILESCIRLRSSVWRE